MFDYGAAKLSMHSSILEFIPLLGGHSLLITPELVKDEEIGTKHSSGNQRIFSHESHTIASVVEGASSSGDCCSHEETSESSLSVDFSELLTICKHMNKIVNFLSFFSL